MHKQFIKLLLILALCTSLLIDWTDPIKAQNGVSATTSIVRTQLNTLVRASDPNIITWEMLGLSERNLVGPYDSFNFSFGLPADWKLIDGASLNLSLGVSISGGVQSGSSSSADTSSGQPPSKGNLGAGTLTVSINNTTLTILALDQIGEIVKTIPIPSDALVSTNKDGIMNVSMVFNSGASCYNFEKMNVVIRTSSYFTLPHESSQPSTDLVNFPRPLYQNSFIPDSAIIVVPDQPSAEELQAALTVASGMGKLSNGAMTFDMVTLGKLTSEQELASHLLFVGKPSSLPALGQLKLPLSTKNGQFSASGGPDDGLVEMINSPWNNAKVVLVVSGNTDQGIIKAAQAVSTGVIRPNEFPNLAVVQEVQATPILSPQPTDQTLADLGYKGRVFENRGVNNVSYNFNVPPGWVVDPDSHFELVYGHSALLDYGASGIVVLLNGKPIGSVRMSDASASNATNKVLINIPTSAVIPGKNRLDVRVNLVPQDICAPQNMRGLWVNIWPESTLHLPLNLNLINPVASLGLASYPAPFSYYPLLDNTAFVLMHNSLESWRAALNIANYLGTNANGSVTALKVFYSDNVPNEERSKYNLLVIGRPSQMPAVMTGINKNLPVPFLDGSDTLTHGNFQVTYDIPPASPMGFMEIMSSPWNPDNVLLAILGNTEQGLSWATSALINPDLRSLLAGNFAAINDQQIITTDTRLSPVIDSNPTPVAEVAILPATNADTTSQPKNQQNTWVFPVFILSIILILLISVFAAIGSWLRHRTRGNTQTGYRRPAIANFLTSIKEWFKKMRNRRKDGGS